MTMTTDDTSVRKLWVADLGPFRDHLLRLDSAGRHARFAMGASDDFVRRYAETSFSLETIIHGSFDGGRLVAAGELRLIGRSRTEAEAAFSVESAYRGCGIGSALMAKVLLAARNRGIRKVYMNCLGSNRAMQRLARRHGAELEFESGDVTGMLLPAAASAASIFREAVADGYGWATAVFDVQARMLRSA